MISVTQTASGASNLELSVQCVVGDDSRLAAIATRAAFIADLCCDACDTGQACHTVLRSEIPLCVSHKNLADTLLQHEDLSDQVTVLNFGGLRGSNAAENCSVAFVTGRNQLPPSAVDQKARAIFWDDEDALKHDEQDADLPKELRGYLLSKRYQDQQAGVQVRAFSDPRIERLHAQERSGNDTGNRETAFGGHNT